MQARAAFFSLASCAKAHLHGASISVSHILGVFSGILRDTMLGQIPLVFRRDQHFYATAVLVGGGVYLGTMPLLHEFSLPVGIVGTLATRLFSVRFGVTWPAFSEPGEVAQEKEGQSAANKNRSSTEQVEE